MKMKTSYSLFLLFLIASHFNKLSAQNFEIVGNTYGIPTLQSASCNLADTCFTLTDDVMTQSGAVWNLETIDLSNSFDASFCMFLGFNDFGADGFAFVLRPVTSLNLGTVGGGLGYVGITPSVAVEFDTYYNAEFPASDIIEDHTALVINGDNTLAQVAPVALSPSGNVEDGNYHVARLVWNANTHLLSMYFDGVLRFSYTEDLVTNIFGGSPDVAWGFTASTGGLNNLQQICFPSINVELEDQMICEGDSALFHFYTDEITEYTWTNSANDTIINWNSMMVTTLTDTSFYASETDTFLLHVVHNNVSSDETVTLTVIENPIFPFSDTTVTYCPDSTELILYALNSGDSYIWEPTNETDSSIVVDGVGWYSVTITEPILQCTSSDSIFVKNMCDGIIDMANVFTPNGDGVNDEFIPARINKLWINELNFQIFNRWGQVVFQSNSDIKWDGKIGNELAADGVYFYTLEYSTIKNKDKTVAKQGFFHLIR